MVKYRAFEDDFEVNGTTVYAIIDGMGLYKSKGFEYLEKIGMGEITPDEKHWYSQQQWLNMFEFIENKIGVETLFHIGTRIPENAVIPPNIKTPEDALKSIDVAYHINHRNSKKEILYDLKRPKNKIMLEGIGHYKYIEGDYENSAYMECFTPYPCDFDMGLIIAFVKIICNDAEIKHVDGHPCRKEGKSDRCLYQVIWN